MQLRKCVVVCLLLISFGCEASFEYPTLTVREQGFGGAITASGNTGFLSNPALLAGDIKNSVSCLQTDLYGLGIPYTQLSLSQQNLAFRMIRWRDGETGAYVWDGALAMGWQGPSRLKVGMNLRGSRFSYQEVRGQNIALDLGLAFLLPKEISAGFVLENALGQSNFSTGRREKPQREMSFGFAGEVRNYHWNLDLASGKELRLGLERWLTPQLALRAGWNGSLAFGMTVNISQLSCEYAYTPTPLGGGHQLGLTYCW